MFFLKNKYVWCCAVMLTAIVQGSERRHDNQSRSAFTICPSASEDFINKRNNAKDEVKRRHARQQTQPSPILQVPAQAQDRQVVHEERADVFERVHDLQRDQLQELQDQILAQQAHNVRLQQENARLKVKAECYAGVTGFFIGLCVLLSITNMMQKTQNPQQQCVGFNNGL